MKNYYSKFLLKYGEIAIKGDNRYLFENVLIKQIKIILYSLGYNFNIRKDFGRIYVDFYGEYDYDEVVNRLSKIFGLIGICPMVQVDEKTYNAIEVKIKEHVMHKYGDKLFTFKVSARRTDKSFGMNSIMLNKKLGDAIINEFPNASVDVHNPHININVEIRDKIYIYSEIIKCNGGLPVGISGKAMLLLSGGIDSPVAGYMVGKRGVAIEAIYFHAPPYTSKRAEQKVIDLANKIAKYTGFIILYVINFTDIQLAIYNKCHHDQLTIIMRRYMMRIAEYFALQDECLGLITGDSIGQVASQTMKSLIAINDVCKLPVYRPLIGMDKNEIIDIAKHINTFETSILPYADCCTIFVARHPVTKPNIDTIKRSEIYLDDVIDDLVKNAIKTVKVVKIKGYE